jgi:tetraacyldisaccharide 4'-kinase
MILKVFFRILLMPISLVYTLVTSVRNWMFDKQMILKSKSYPKPVICVGNLTVGGTGKTPVVAYLIEHLSRNHKLAVLSRGYGRKTKGYLAVGDGQSAETVGDEPFQLFSKYGSQAQFFVCEKRVQGLDRIFRETNTEYVVLDDAYQHRYVKPMTNIMLTDYNRLFYKDFVMPSGRLREARFGANRADILIVTKCPNNISENEKTNIEKSIRKYVNASTHIFFSKIIYAEVVNIFGVLNYGSGVILLTGIANASHLVKYLSPKYNLVEHLEYSDHHHFSTNELETIVKNANKSNASILTTEKDYQRLKPQLDLFMGVNLAYIPVKFDFFGKDSEFLTLLTQNHN